MLLRRVERISSWEDGLNAEELQPGLLQKLGEFQQGLPRALRIDPEGQSFDAIPLGHPERNRESLLLKLDLDMLPAIEPMRAKDLQFLEMQRMKRIKHRNSTRIAGIIAAGLSARPT